MYNVPLKTFLGNNIRFLELQIDPLQNYKYVCNINFCKEGQVFIHSPFLKYSVQISL